MKKIPPDTLQNVGIQNYLQNCLVFITELTAWSGSRLFRKCVHSFFTSFFTFTFHIIDLSKIRMFFIRIHAEFIVRCPPGWLLLPTHVLHLDPSPNEGHEVRPRLGVLRELLGILGLGGTYLYYIFCHG